MKKGGVGLGNGCPVSLVHVTRPEQGHTWIPPGLCVGQRGLSSARAHGLALFSLLSDLPPPTLGPDPHHRRLPGPQPAMLSSGSGL